LADADQRYNFLCPNCSGNFSIQLERIPPVQARFRCPHCREPMDFPSRDEARELIRRQSGEVKPVTAPAPPASASAGVKASGAPPAALPAGSPLSPGGARFRVEKLGFESDVFDRRGIRNLIRTGEVVETDLLRVDESGPVTAESLPFLKSLFNLARSQTGQPPRCCRTHTDQVAFFRCHDTGRPLCEKCAEEKKFGGQTLRVCQHCGGTAEDLVPA
jgi:predicted Zn finger-like uncharacterized protein